DDDKLDVEAWIGVAQKCGDVLSLPLRQPAAAGGDAQAAGHARSNRSRTAAALRSPRGVPASRFRLIVGSCSSLATMAPVTASTASRSRSSTSSSRLW